MTATIRQIAIYYDDGTSVIINGDDIVKIAKLNEALTFVERAKEVYRQLEPIFRKETKH